MPQPAPALALAALAVLIWYLAEWDRAHAAGRSLAPPPPRPRRNLPQTWNSLHPAGVIDTTLRSTGGTPT